MRPFPPGRVSMLMLQDAGTVRKTVVLASLPWLYTKSAALLRSFSAAFALPTLKLSLKNL
jgi:hypothetical protein